MSSDLSKRLIKIGKSVPWIVVFVLFAGSHLAYIHDVHPIPVHDSTAYIIKADRIAQLFVSQPLHRALPGILRVEQMFRPPLHPLRAILLNVNSPGIFPRILQSNIAVFLVIALMLLHLETRMLDNPAPGLSIILWLSFPITIHQATAFFSELTLTPIVLLYYIMLFNPLPVKSQNGITWGFLTGLGCLTKLTFPAFALTPLLWQLTRLKSGIRWRWVIGFITVSTIVALPWYLVNEADIVRNFNLNMTQSPDRPCGGMLSIDQFLWYFRSSRHMFSQIGRLLCMAGILLAFRKRTPMVWQIASSLLVGYLVFSLLAHKEPRHIFAFSPLIALLASYGFLSLRQAPLRYTIVFVCITSALLNIPTLYFAKPLLHVHDHPESLGHKIPGFDIGVRPLDRSNESAHFDRLIELIGTSDQSRSIAFGSVHERFCGEAFIVFCRYERGIRNFRVGFFGGYLDRWGKDLGAAEYYICRSDRQSLCPQSPVFSPLESTRAAISGEAPDARSISEHFTRIGVIPIDNPEESVIEVYKRTTPCDDNEKWAWHRLFGIKPKPLYQSDLSVSRDSRLR